jgi:hypothetical protein
MRRIYSRRTHKIIKYRTVCVHCTASRKYCLIRYSVADNVFFMENKNVEVVEMKKVNNLRNQNISWLWTSKILATWIGFCYINEWQSTISVQSASSQLINRVKLNRVRICKSVRSTGIDSDKSVYKYGLCTGTYSPDLYFMIPVSRWSGVDVSVS